MVNISNFLFFFSFVISVPSVVESEKACDVSDVMHASVICDPILEEMFSIDSESEQSSRNHTVKADLCDVALDCITRYPCHEKNGMKREFGDFCRTLRYADSNITPCFRGFFKSAYLSQFSREKSCLQDFTKLNTLLLLNDEEFIAQKSCFLNYVDDNCNTAAQKYLTDHFNDLTNSLSFSSTGLGCDSAHSQLSAMQCDVLEVELESRVYKLKDINLRASRTQLLHTVGLCRDSNLCMEKSRYPRKDKKNRENIVDTCTLLEQL